MPRLLDH